MIGDRLFPPTKYLPAVDPPRPEREYRHYCFPAGTLVRSKEGYAAIESVEDGCEILGFNLVDSAVEPSVVRAVCVGSAQELIELAVGGEVIMPTPDHPFWVSGQGWTRAGELKNDDLLLRADGETSAVQYVRRVLLPRPIRVYSVQVLNTATFYVGRGGYLVHNKIIF